MSYMTVTITDATKGPFSLASLFGIAGATIAGVTVTPSAAANPPAPAQPAPAHGTPRQTIIQADPGNGDGDFGYVSTDASALPTASGGVGAKLAAGAFYPTLENAPLRGIYLSASANGVAFNVIAQGGVQ